MCVHVTISCCVCDVASELTSDSMERMVCELERVAGKLKREESSEISVICPGVSDPELFYHALRVVCEMPIDL